ncbi:MAG: flagellar hook-basal body complex protein [Rhodocyclaceae bacterium]
MLNSMYIGASGLVTHQSGVDAVSNNLVNMNTAAFKKARVAFRDVYANELSRAERADGEQPSSELLPSGVAVSGTQRIFSEGEYKSTGNVLDWAIRGTGLFEVSLPDGSPAYTRNGQFRVNTEGLLVTADGYPLSQNIEIPEGASELSVERGGCCPGQAAWRKYAAGDRAAGNCTFQQPGRVAAAGRNRLCTHGKFWGGQAG